MAVTVVPVGKLAPMTDCPVAKPEVAETLLRVGELRVVLPVTVKASLLAEIGSGWLAATRALAALDMVTVEAPALTAVMVVAEGMPEPEINCPTAMPAVDETVTVLLPLVTVPVTTVIAGRGLANRETLVAVTLAFCDKVRVAAVAETAEITVLAGTPVPTMGCPTARPAVAERPLTEGEPLVKFPVTGGGAKLPAAANRVWAYSLALGSTPTAPGSAATTAGASDRVRVPPAKELMVVAPVGQGWAWVGWLYGMSLPTMVWPAARPMTLGTLVMVLPPAARVPVRAATTLQEASVTRKDMVSPPEPLKVEPWDMVMVPPEMPEMVDPGRMPWPATGAPGVSPRMDETSVMEKFPLLTLPVKEIP